MADSSAWSLTGARPSQATTSTTRAAGNPRQPSQSWSTRCAPGDQSEAFYVVRVGEAAVRARRTAWGGTRRCGRRTAEVCFYLIMPQEPPFRFRPPPVSTGSGGFAPIAVACWSFSSSQKPTSRRSRHIASRCGGGERISGFGRCPPLAALSIGPNKPNPGYATVASEHRRRPFAVEVRAPHGFVAQVRKLRRTGVTDLGRSVPCENAPANANANAARASEAPGA